MKNFLLIILIISSTATAQAPVKQSYDDISIINLIANPERYSGKLVSFSGIITVEVENNAIWLSKSDMDNSVTKNAVWIKMDSEKFHRYISLSERYVIIKGKFTSKDCNGQMCAFSGTLIPMEVLSLTK